MHPLNLPIDYMYRHIEKWEPPSQVSHSIHNFTKIPTGSSPNVVKQFTIAAINTIAVNKYALERTWRL